MPRWDAKCRSGRKVRFLFNIQDSSYRQPTEYTYPEIIVVSPF